MFCKVCRKKTKNLSVLLSVSSCQNSFYTHPDAHRWPVVMAASTSEPDLAGTCYPSVWRDSEDSAEVTFSRKRRKLLTVATVASGRPSWFIDPLPATAAAPLNSRRRRLERDCCKSSGHWPVKDEMSILNGCVAQGCSYSVVKWGTEWAFLLYFYCQQTPGGAHGVEQWWGIWPAGRTKLRLTLGHGGPGHHHEPSKESKGQTEVFVCDCNQTQFLFAMMSRQWKVQWCWSWRTIWSRCSGRIPLNHCVLQLLTGSSQKEMQTKEVLPVGRRVLILSLEPKVCFPPWKVEVEVWFGFYKWYDEAEEVGEGLTSWSNVDLKA